MPSTSPPSSPACSLPPLTDAELSLLICPNIGPALHPRLLKALGSAEAILGASTAILCQVDGLGPTRAAAIRRALDRVDPDRERQLASASGVEIVARADPRYPPLLATIADAPPALWVRGDATILQSTCVALVGSRRCTQYGREQAAKLATGLVECGFTVVSGGARGIDASAHRAALHAGGATVAVVGCGLGVCYPPEHDELFESIVSGARRGGAALAPFAAESAISARSEASELGAPLRGAVVSELPMLHPPRAEAFPRRNRLISGLALGVVVVEAAVRSGALITARVAAESQHREVMALPGPVDSPVSAGCHRALREGWAGLVTGIDDVLAQLSGTQMLLRGAADAANARSEATGPVVSPQDDSRHAVLDALRTRGPHAPADLATAACLPIGAVLAALTVLQIEGRVLRSGRGFALVGDRFQG